MPIIRTHCDINADVRSVANNPVQLGGQESSGNCTVQITYVTGERSSSCDYRRIEQQYNMICSLNNCSRVAITQGLCKCALLQLLGWYANVLKKVTSGL
jgi:hypothetical protein